jgi:hypothetical protein
MDVQGLTMSAITALYHVRRIASEQGLSVEAAAAVAPAAGSSLAPHDYQRALQLHAAIPDVNLDERFATNIPAILDALLMVAKPSWFRLLVYGRSRATRSMSGNELQLFRQGGLLDESPADWVVAWWDKWSGIARAAQDQAQLLAGRVAEAKSLEFERTRLAAAGCEREPEWIALEDSTVGYDIASFTKIGEDWIPIGIEVKSTSGLGRIFITRHEFDVCSQMTSRYRLHIWVGAAVEPVTFSHDVILSMAPQDSTSSIWQDSILQFNVE